MAFIIDLWELCLVVGTSNLLNQESYGICACHFLVWHSALIGDGCACLVVLKCVITKEFRVLLVCAISLQSHGGHLDVQSATDEIRF